MFEYIDYDTGDKITINPTHISYIKPCQVNPTKELTAISIYGNCVIVVEESYSRVSAQFQLYIDSI